MPAEVERLMAAVTADGSSVKSKGPSTSKEIFSSPRVESRPKSEGFGAQRTVVETTATMETSVSESNEPAVTDTSSTSVPEETEESRESDSDAVSEDSRESRKKRRKGGRKDRKK